MLTQRLRHRIDIQELTVGQNQATGAQKEDWESIRGSSEPDLIPAEIVALSGREFIAAESIQAGVNTRVTVRWREDIVPSMRVVHEGDFYDIKAVLPDKTLRRHLALMCERGVNAG